METIQLNIHGMTCNGCVNNVKNVLQNIPGVVSVETSLKQNRATVIYHAEQVNPAQLKAAVENAGYDVI